VYRGAQGGPARDKVAQRLVHRATGPRPVGQPHGTVANVHRAAAELIVAGVEHGGLDGVGHEAEAGVGGEEGRRGRPRAQGARRRRSPARSPPSARAPRGRRRGRDGQRALARAYGTTDAALTRAAEVDDRRQPPGRHAAQPAAAGLACRSPGRRGEPYLVPAHASGKPVSHFTERGSRSGTAGTPGDATTSRSGGTGLTATLRPPAECAGDRFSRCLPPGTPWRTRRYRSPTVCRSRPRSRCRRCCPWSPRLA
jgi:hypothetical protein